MFFSILFILHLFSPAETEEIVVFFGPGDGSNGHSEIVRFSDSGNILNQLLTCRKLICQVRVPAINPYQRTLGPQCTDTLEGILISAPAPPPFSVEALTIRTRSQTNAWLSVRSSRSGRLFPPWNDLKHWNNIFVYSDTNIYFLAGVNVGKSFTGKTPPTDWFRRKFNIKSATHLLIFFTSLISYLVVEPIFSRYVYRC